MRRIGTPPKIFKKYNISRYNSSHDAEYKSAYVDEYAQLRAANRSSQTTRDDFPFYLVSNQGFVGTVDKGAMYEEDFRANACLSLPDTQAKGHVAIKGGYVSFQNQTDGNQGEILYIGDGKPIEIFRYLEDGNLTTVYTNCFFTSRSIVRNYYTYWGSTNLGYTTTIAETSATWDDITRTGSSSFKYYHRGDGTPGMTTAAVPSSSGNGVNNCRGYNAGALRSGGYVRFISPSGSLQLSDSTHITQQTGGELFVNNGNLYSLEVGRVVHVTQYSPRNTNVSGRYWFHRDGYSGDYYLIYYDPESDTTTTAVNACHGMINADNAFALAWITDPNAPGGRAYSLYFKGVKVRDGFEFNNSTDMYIFVGSCCFEKATGVMTNYETGETRDMSILSELLSSRSGVYPVAGLYAEVICVSSTSNVDADQDRYVIGWDGIRKFRAPSTDFFAYPNERHATSVYWIKDQVLSIIGKDGYQAYDLQTFMRLDNLPGFEGAVELVKDFNE